MTVIDRWVGLFRRLLPQLAKFGVVGIVGLVVDVGGFNVLRFAGGEGPLYDRPLTAKVVSTVAAVIVSWLGHRYWTFHQTRRSAVHHEFLLFSVVCGIGALIALVCLWVSHYLLGFQSALADNVSANGVGLVLGTLFRFWAFRTHVFSEAAPPLLDPEDHADADQVARDVPTDVDTARAQESTRNSERPARRRI